MNIRQKKRGKLDILQNIAITVLSVSAALLFLRTQLYTLSPSGGQLDRLLSGPSASSSIVASTAASELQTPVHVAISGDGAYGRYGNLTLTTADEAFASLKTFLQEALGSARMFSSSDENAFFAALNRTSVYYDFLEPLPLSVLAELIGASAEEEYISARQLILSASEDGIVQLTLSDGAGSYFRCDTAISSSDLLAAVNHFELGNGYFAFDYTDLDGHYSRVSPSSLFLDPLPTLPVLAVSSSLSDSSGILSNLGFNPHTNSRYTEANGTEVIVEGNHSVRLLPDGTVRYKGSDEASESALTVEAVGDIPTLQEAAIGVSDLLSQLMRHYPNDASLYLLSIQHSGERTTLLFDYQFSGIPIRFSDGAPAAEVQLTGTCVSALSLRLRQYAAGTNPSLLLPTKQAVAIAAQQPGQELFIGYTDNGGSTSSANWLLEQ